MTRPPMVVGRAMALLGAVAVGIACFLPWSQYAGFPGKMLNTGFPGGARMHALLLALFAAALLTRVPSRVATARAAAGFGTAVTVFTVTLIAYVPGSPSGVAAGGWVAVGGNLLFLGGSYLMEPDAAKPVDWSWPDRSWRPLAEVAVTLAVCGLALFVFVKGLGIPDSLVASGPDTVFRGTLSVNDVTNGSEFVSYLLVVIGVAVAARRLGLLGWLRAATQRQHKVLVAGALVAAVAFPFTQDGNPYALRIAASIGVFAAAAMGLNIVVGLAGLLDLGYIAFFGVGAYFAALFSGTSSSVFHTHLPFLLVLPLGAAIAGLFGIVLGAPTLRLRGDYLAIVTLGFGEIFRIAAQNLSGGSSGPRLTNGPSGISDIPDLTLPGYNLGDDHTLFGVPLPFQANYYWLEVLLVVVVMAAFLRLSESRIGRAWVAIREDETAAAATGINTTRLKLLAFALGATLAGAAGTVDAHVLRVAEPNSFTFTESSLLLAAVILGGMGTVPGALLGATLLYMLPEKLRFLHDLRLMAFGIALILIMRLRPEGLIASKRRQREFHETDPTVMDRSGALDPPPGAHA